jgi:hypothetical protein
VLGRTNESGCFAGLWDGLFLVTSDDLVLRREDAPRQRRNVGWIAIARLVVYEEDVSLESVPYSMGGMRVCIFKARQRIYAQPRQYIESSGVM